MSPRERLQNAILVENHQIRPLESVDRYAVVRVKSIGSVRIG